MTSPFTIINNIPPAYTELSDAISELYYALGSKSLCGACFAGRLGALVHGRHDEMGHFISKGCCGVGSKCVNSQPTGCVQKPVGCAKYSCEALRMLVPERIIRMINRAAYLAFCTPRQRSGYRDYIPGSGCYPDQLRSASTYGFRRTDIIRFRRYTARIRRITAWVARSGWHPNWPLVEYLTRARVQLGGRHAS